MTRELAWKDTFVGKLVQEVTDVSCDGTSVLLDTTYNFIGLELTADQWTKIFSALLEGADLTYPDTSHEVVWWWLKGVECTMTFCQRMIECFIEDEDTREAMIQAMIAELLADPVQAEAWVSAMRQLGIGVSGGNGQIGSPNAELSQLMLGNCDDFELLYGKCYEFVGALNVIAEDVLQWVELYTNDEELASVLADNIPAIGAIPASVLETALWLQETVTETYLSAWDTTTQEYWACVVYCFVLNGDCELNFEAVNQAYADKLLTFTPPSYSDNLVDWLAWFADLLTLTDTELIGAMHLFILTILVRTGEMFGSTYRTVQIPVAQAEPIEPLCPCCEPIYLDFADDTTATPVYAEGGVPASTIWQALAWEGSLPCWRAGNQFFIEGAEASRYGFWQIEVDPDCFYVGFSIEMQITEVVSGSSNFSVRLYDTNVIPRLADNHFAEDVLLSVSSSQYHTFSMSFAPRRFTSGYMVWGGGTGGDKDDWVARFKYLNLFV